MKRALLITASFVLLAGKVFGESGLGSQPQYPEKIWIASITATADTNVLLASAPYVVHGVVCGSCSVNNAGADYIQFFHSTMSTFGNWVTTLTPKIPLSSYTFRPQNTWIFDVHGSSHIFYDKKGTSEIMILGDWVNSSDVNPRRIINKIPK